MPKRLFDTSFLISHWNSFPRDQKRTENSVGDWARKLIELHATDWICTPVQIEMLAGTRSEDDLKLHRAYLQPFKMIDQRNIPAEDWRRAQETAQRVLDDGKPRQLGDCLIRAIATRFHCDVLTKDRSFPSRRTHA